MLPMNDRQKQNYATTVAEIQQTIPSIFNITKPIEQSNNFAL
jgi:hypothetical protein